MSLRVIGLSAVLVTRLLVGQAALAQERPALNVGHLSTAPTIDGVIGEKEWSEAAIVDAHFLQIEPTFGAESPFRTVARVGQTDEAIYVAIEAFDPDLSRLSASVTTRDGPQEDDDSVAVLLDTFQDRRTAYVFSSNALSTQLDLRIADNGRTEDARWDAAWSNAASRLEDRWVVEFEIPLVILRFRSGQNRTWGINLLRTVPRRLETATWSGPGEIAFRVSDFGELTDLDLPAGEGKTWQVIPYALVAAGDGEDTSEAGVDLRWRPSSAVGLDATVNPDFALVEADVETINLSRFELFVPEKRPFFLEGNEMYTQRVRQFYSRRVGDISWGTKANGKVGGMDFSAIVTSEDHALASGPGTGQADYGIVRLQQGLPRGSNVGLLAGSRHFEGDDAGSVGIDTTLFFTKTLGLTGQFLEVHGPTSDGGRAWFIRPAFDSSTTHFHVRYTNLDTDIVDDFNAIGFLRDDDRREFDTELQRTFWLEGGAVEKVQAGANYNRYESQEGVLRSYELRPSVEVVFRNGWEIELDYFDEFQLFEKEFYNERTELTVGWDSREGHEIGAFVGTGSNFDNDLDVYGLEAAWAFGDRLRTSYSFTRLVLDPDPEDMTTWIHVAEVLYSFHPDLFVKLFAQVNTSIDKENVQLVGVWRFKPPFGALQVAYQRGTSLLGEVSEQGDTLFTKFSWVF